METVDSQRTPRAPTCHASATLLKETILRKMVLNLAVYQFPIKFFPQGYRF